MGPLRPPSAGIPNYNTFDDKHLIGMSLSCNRIVVSTSRCGRDNPGSNPGYSIFYTTDEYTQVSILNRPRGRVLENFFKWP